MINWLNLESLELIKAVVALILAYLVIAGVAGAFQAWVAEKAGDSTAADLGMKTINPFVHVDPTSLWLMPLGYLLFRVVVGLSRPIPIIWHNFTKPLRTFKMVLVAVAQPIAIMLILIFMVLVQRLILIALGLTHNMSLLPVEIGVYEYIMLALMGFSAWFIPYELLMSGAQIFTYEQELRGKSVNYMIALIIVPLFGAVLLLDISHWCLVHFVVGVSGVIESVIKFMVIKGGLS